jgi:alkylation response protein AidB-like acyl-CoA dehydrogenase
MLVPEELGGGSVSGVGLLDAALVADVVGRHVQPGPFIPMNVVASALAAHGSARLQADVLPAIVAGELVATWACAALDGATDDGAGVHVVRTGDDLTIRGARGFVPEAQSADHLLVTATLDGAPAQVLVPAAAAGVALRPLAGLDLSRRFAHVDLDDVVVPEDALLGGGAAALEAQLQVAVSLAVSDTVGAMDALFAMTVDYAKGRIAFKHLLADQAVYLESCKAVAVAAASAAARGDERAGEIVSMAAAYVGDQGHELAQVCLQVHGGIGYTWEHDLHLLMRRIQSNASLYGEPTWHRERVCSLHRLGEAGEEVAGA